MLAVRKQINVYHTLQIAVAMCFIGHGAFGIITKPIWCNYFAVFGIGQTMAYKLMPIVGSFDILFGVTILFYPVRAIAVWLVFWGLMTAMLRPLSGEPFAELIERAGNFGAPLALLLLSGNDGKGFGQLFKKMDFDKEVNAINWPRAIICLKITAFLLFAGHGWLNLIGKKSLLAQYTTLGFHQPGNTAFIIGTIELVAAFSILVKPTRPVLFGFLIWKISSELFYPHYGLFEWIERGGSYGILLALWFLCKPATSLMRLQGGFLST